jgi:hypothetical protein
MVLKVGLLSEKSPQGRPGSCQETYSKEANWGLGTSEGMVERSAHHALGGRKSSLVLGPKGRNSHGPNHGA